MSTATHTHRSAATAYAPYGAQTDDGQRRPWTILAVALTAQILVVLDISVVNTALPSIARSLHLGSGSLQWLVTAYLMMSGGGLLLGGRIADLLPRRRVFLVGLGAFTGASIVSGFATSGAELIAARAIQGMSAALLTPAAMSIITTTYSGDQKKKGLALWGAVGSLSVAFGVLAGGALTTWGSWHLIFWINGPIGAVAFVIALRTLPTVATEHAGLSQFDLPGAAAALGGLAALMYGLGSTSTHGWWSAPTVVSFAVAAGLIASFVAIERRAAQPLVPSHTWKVSTLVSGTTVMLGVTGVLVGTIFLTSIYLQTVLHYSALRTGIAVLPLALAITAGAHIAQHLLSRTAPRTIAAAGMTIAAAGAVLLSFANGHAHYAPNLLPGLLALGIGAGMTFVSVSVSSMMGIPPQHAGLAAGFLMSGHEIGAALGVAVLSAAATGVGSLTSVSGVTDAFGAGAVAAAVLSGLVALVAFMRMPATTITPGAAGMHLHH